MYELNSEEVSHISGGSLLIAAAAGAVVCYSVWAAYDVITGRPEKTFKLENIAMLSGLGALVATVGALVV